MVEPLLMGIVNATPDSFSDGGLYAEAQSAVAHGLRLAAESADVLDIGGESTRPGAEDVSVDEELGRVLPVIEALARRTRCRLSIDTRKPDVARMAVKAGAVIWNDVSALTYDVQSVDVAAELGCEIVLMHAKGSPKTMQLNPRYDYVVDEVFDYLHERIAACLKAGIPKWKLIADPGIGFGKTLEHNLALLSSLERFKYLGVRILVGASRKRFIAALDRDGPPSERLGGSLAAALNAARSGAAILRVHDVAATRQALAVASALEKAQTPR